MPMAPWIDYEACLAGIAGGGWRVVGWGAGEAFSAIYGRAPLRLDYLVDADPRKWGTRHHGFEVRWPQAIAGEDPARTVVIIYPYRAHGRAIVSALDALGPYRALPPFDPGVLLAFIRRLHAGLEPDLKCKPRAVSGGAIVVQGPLVPGVTDTVLRWHAARNQRDWMILSTWADSDPAFLDQLAPFCDRVVLSDPPLRPGAQHRNYQIVSTRAGLAEAERLGLAKVIKTRTDTLFTTDAAIERATALQAAAGNDACAAVGLHNRIVVTERYTMRYMPCMVSDILMFGDVPDMVRYWAAPLDGRDFDPYAPAWMARSYRTIAQEKALAEIYVPATFLERAGRAPAFTVEDHWAILRDLFVVVDERWFGHVFPRYDLFGLDDGTPADVANTLVDSAFWQRLRLGPAMAAEAASIDLDAMVYRDMWRGAPVIRRP